VDIGTDAAAIPNESSDMVFLLQINTLNHGGARAIERQTHFDGTGLIVRVIGETLGQVDGL
jgi:hypothetical protein